MFSLGCGARKGWDEMGKRTIVSHRVKIQSHQIWQQEVIATCIPCAIANIHGIRAVCAAPWRGEVVLWCHCVSSVSKELLSATARRQPKSLLPFAQCQWEPEISSYRYCINNNAARRVESWNVMYLSPALSSKFARCRCQLPHRLIAVVNKAYRVRSSGNAYSPPKCRFVCALM